MKKYKAVIFDMDGTIVDTEKVWREACKKYLTQKGVLLTPEKMQILEKKSHGLSSHKIAELFKEITGIPDDLETIMKEQSGIGHTLIEEGIDFINGFEPFHKTLGDRNIKTAIATNATPAGLEKTNGVLNLKNFFGSHMYDISYVNFVGKPSPDIYLYAAKQLGMPPSECIAIEDSAHGVEAAVNAGMYCIAIDSSKVRHLLHKAHLIVDDYHEIPVDTFFESPELPLLH